MQLKAIGADQREDIEEVKEVISILKANGYTGACLQGSQYVLGITPLESETQITK